MKLEDCDTELNRLRVASDRISANLVELEIDSGRQLLEASTLTGESAARWSAASAALTDPWEWRGLLEGFLERARELRRSSRRASDLRALLTGPSIELTRAPVPLAERDLLGTPETALRCTADELLVRMSGAFDEVKAAVAGFARAWDTLTARLIDARAALERARTLAVLVGEPEQVSELDRAAGRLDASTAQLRSDPLAIAPTEAERLIDSLQALERDLQATAALRRELDARLGWSDRARTLLDQADRIAEANRAPLEARNQLRALLEAYQIKAARLGTLEDPQLEQTFAQAHQTLYTAPTDLALAAQLVRRYQELLNAPRPATELSR